MSYGSTLVLPSAPTSGNTLLLSVAAGNGVTVTPPTGFTYQKSATLSGTTSTVKYYTKTSDGTESDVTPSWSAAHTYQTASVQEWSGSITLGTTSGGYLNGVSSPQTLGPTDAPPTSTAVPSYLIDFFNFSSGDTYTLPAGWTYPSSFSGSLYGGAVPATESAPNAAVSPTLTYTGTTSKIYWANIWIDGAGGGSTTSISGSTSLSTSVSGALDAIAALDGSAGLASSVSGTLEGSAELVGSATLSTAVSGSLGTGANLVGSASISTTASGDLSATASLDGSSSIAFTSTGTLQTGAGLSGTASLASTASGTLEGSASLAGSSGVSFAATGTVSISGGLSASTSFALGASGTLEGSAALDGSAPIVFVPSGTLSERVSIQGSADIAFANTGTIDSEHPISGSTSFAFTNTGSLSAISSSGALFGNAGILFAESAELSASKAVTIFSAVYNARQNIVDSIGT